MKKRHERHADKLFRQSLQRYLKAGVPAMRGMSAEEYARRCRSLWDRCKTDHVYQIRMFVEPLIDKPLIDGNDDIYCVLVARCDPDGNLVDAAPGYQREPEPGIFFSKVPIGSPYGYTAKQSKSAVETYLVAYFDILGFKSKLKKEKLENVRKQYLELIETAIKPQQAQWSKNLALNTKGDLVSALMWTPIEAAYASDSLILFCPYHFSFIEEFLHRSALLFCLALRSYVPLRGAITTGSGVFDTKKNVFLGQPLVEASSIEKELDWVGIAFGQSIKNMPIPPWMVQLIAAPMTPKGEGLCTGLVLDWPSVWRKTFNGSAIPYLAALDGESEQDRDTDARLREKIQARYEHAAIFVEFSAIKENWFLPKGSQIITADDISINPLLGADLSYFHQDHRYKKAHHRFSMQGHLQSLKDWAANFDPADPDAWDHNLSHGLFRPSAPDRRMPFGDRS